MHSLKPHTKPYLSIYLNIKYHIKQIITFNLLLQK